MKMDKFAKFSNNEYELCCQMENVITNTGHMNIYESGEKNLAEKVYN